MKVLAIESSAGPASCALTEDGRILASAGVHTGLTHSQTLVPMVDGMLKNAGVPLQEVDLLAVAAGPGSFTGVRIGVAAVKGLAFARDIPCVGVSTLAAMARAADGIPFDGVVCAAMDARCRQVYTALFDCRGGRLSRRTPDEALTLEELEKRLLFCNKSIFLVGDGAELCYNTFNSRIPGVILAPPHLRFQQAAGVAAEAARNAEKAVSADKLQPVYLRLPQAERELRARQALGGAAGK
ncbi:MAG TPA: tRNA (adenosine(37)-N6)-threonylcarbamoyltransferase complex dimerization subunit type 1 TsaB [Firmicutes bacterium]|nr:tRNA (adenosine(37)-N6)-threonylcarbamoyltransferase complex dimerization subunit type 1 TsaB [Bacillota bacterium]